MQQPFWERKPLTEMTPAEWESLCDGCGQCCLHKLEDAETEAILNTNVACKLLDTTTCRCQHYPERQQYVPGCQILTPENVPKLHWLPNTCAYRLLAAGDSLPPWHPLLSGDPASVEQAGVSVKGRVIPEQQAGPLETHIIDWWPRQQR